MHKPEGSPQHSIEMQRVLREVTDRFLARCHDQVEILERFLDEVARRGIKTDPGMVYQEAHKICGIARTLGFSGIGDAAANLEEVTASEAWVPGAFERDRVLASLDDLIDEMLAAIESNS